MAKNVEYATAVLDAWKQQEQDDDDDDGSNNAEWKSVVYYHNDDDQPTTSTPLYGHIVQNANHHQHQHSTTTAGVVLWHTGAGPHDLFLLWKAAALVNHNHNWVVLIADLLSDDTGWAWDAHRTWYNAARDALLLQSSTTDNDGHAAPIRSVLRNRIRAGVDVFLKKFDSNNKAARIVTTTSH